MITGRCGRLTPHGAHVYIRGASEDLLQCEGVPRTSTGPRFTMGADVRAGDVVVVHPRSGLLVPAFTRLMYGRAEEYAWDLYADAVALAEASGCTFAEAATNLVQVSDALGRR